VADASSYSLSPLKPRAFVNQLDRMMFAKIESFEPATREQLKLAHDADHVDGVLDGRLPNGFGNKSPAVASSLLYTVGSIIAATREAGLPGTRATRAVLSPVRRHQGFTTLGMTMAVVSAPSMVCWWRLWWRARKTL